MYYFVSKEKYCQMICTCLVWFCFTLCVCVHFCNEIERYQLWKSLKYFDILQPTKNVVRFEYFLWENVWFCFISIVWVHFNHKTKKSQFRKSLKYFDFFYQKNDVRFAYVLSNSVWFDLNFVVWVKFVLVLFYYYLYLLALL